MENHKPIPRFRVKKFILSDGSIKTYYVWDGRGAGMKDIRLGTDRDHALKLYERCEAGAFPIKEKPKRAYLKVMLPSNKVERASKRKTYSLEKKQSIWAGAPESIRRMYYGAECRAKKKGRSFSISPADLLALISKSNGLCAITSIPFDDPGKKSPFSMSFDRIDSSKGYEMGNLRMVCLLANMAMSTWGIEPVMRFAQELISKGVMADAATYAVIDEPML